MTLLEKLEGPIYIAAFLIAESWLIVDLWRTYA